MAEILELKEAVACYVKDGSTIAMEGFTHLIPHAAGHEIIRQGRRNLHAIRMTPDMVYDQLIGAGCVSKLTFSWAAILVLDRCIAFEMLSRTTGHIKLKSKNIVTPEGLLGMWQERRGFRLEFCEVTLGPIW